MKKLKKIKIKLNGKIKTINDESSLHELINELKIPITKVAIEFNKEIVDKKKLLKNFMKKYMTCTTKDSNLQPSDSKSDILSS